MHARPGSNQPVPPRSAIGDQNLPAVPPARVGISFDPSNTSAAEMRRIFHQQGSEISTAEAQVLIEQARARGKAASKVRTSTKKSGRREAEAAHGVPLEDLLKLLQELRSKGSES